MFNVPHKKAASQIPKKCCSVTFSSIQSRLMPIFSPENIQRAAFACSLKLDSSLISKHCGLAELKGHSLHIGGTLLYLLKGVPFNVVKVMGRWAGEAFTLYLRHHALVLAPFLQANQLALETFNCVAMPPVC